MSARIRYLSCLPGLLLAGTLAAQGTPAPAVDVAVFAIEAGSSADTQLTRLAHQLTARLVGALQSRKLSVGRARASDTVTARVSVHGSLTGEAGAYTAELRLLQGRAGEELRSYMFGPGDVKGVLGLADRAAPRIAAVVDQLGPSGR
jgi:hypothetical protein